jgi:putative acetyltransferase
MRVGKIKPSDNATVANLIRSVLESYGLDKPGTAYFDPQLDELSSYYAGLARSAYYVLEDGGQILGVGGFGPVTEEICELQKLYLHASYRGQGLSRRILERIFQDAKSAGYQKIYLETTKELEDAVKVYEHFGFHSLPQPLDNQAGHTAMDIWMIKDLSEV